MDLTGLVGHVHCTQRKITAKTLCNDNKLSPKPQLERENETSGEAMYPIMHIKAV